MVLSGLESLTNHSCLARVSCMKDRTRLYSLFPAEFSQVARWDKNLPYSSLRLDQQYILSRLNRVTQFMLPCIFFRGDVSCYRRTHLPQPSCCCIGSLVFCMYTAEWSMSVPNRFGSRLAHSHENCMHAAGLISCCPILINFLATGLLPSILISRVIIYTSTGEDTM